MSSFSISWVKNRRQEWPKCRLSPAAGCYFEPCLCLSDILLIFCLFFYFSVQKLLTHRIRPLGHLLANFSLISAQSSRLRSADTLDTELDTEETHYLQASQEVKLGFTEKQRQQEVRTGLGPRPSGFQLRSPDLSTIPPPQNVCSMVKN